MPMTFDQYGNCGFYCLYCFSTYLRDKKNKLGSEKYYKRQAVSSVSVTRFKKLFDPNTKSIFSYLIKKRRPFQWGGLSDPFCPLEEQFGVGLEILKFLAEIKYPVSFSSKGDLLLRNKQYWDAFMLNKENYHYKATIITLNEDIQKKLELGAPSPMRRFEVLGTLAGEGVETTLRLRPYMPGITDKDIPEIIKIAADKGVKSVSAEFFCMDMRSNGRVREKYRKISRLVGFDLFKFYRILSSKRSNYLRLNYQYKEKYFGQLKHYCEKYGLRLHVSDAHHKELGCTGSCCGLPDDHPTLSNYQKSQFTNAIVKARQNGSVRFSEISEDFEWLKGFKWNVAKHASGADECNRKKWTMFEYMRNCWNDPKNHLSPYKYFGGALVPDGLDENKDIIYKYAGVWK